jgi:hypothetical protein
MNQLMPLVLRELRKLAGGYLKGERPNHTLQPTAEYGARRTETDARVIAR